MPVNTRKSPEGIHEMLLFRIFRVAGIAGRLPTRMCEARFGLTKREWTVLATVAANEGLISSQIAEKALLDPVRTSRALAGLVERGWVERCPLPGDRRRVALYLTAQGRAQYEQIFPEMKKIHFGLVEALTDEEYESLLQILEKIRQRSQEMQKDEAFSELPRVDRSRFQSR